MPAPRWGRRIGSGVTSPSGVAKRRSSWEASDGRSWRPDSASRLRTGMLPLATHPSSPCWATVERSVDRSCRKALRCAPSPPATRASRDDYVTVAAGMIGTPPLQARGKHARIARRRASFEMPRDGVSPSPARRYCRAGYGTRIDPGTPQGGGMNSGPSTAPGTSSGSSCRWGYNRPPSHDFPRDLWSEREWAEAFVNPDPSPRYRWFQPDRRVTILAIAVICTPLFVARSPLV